MFAPKIELKDGTLHARHDTYLLETISAISTRRPFQSASLVVSGFLGIFAAGFRDILYPGEIAALGTAAAIVLVLGLSIGQLRLTSRDLRGTPIADAVYGNYYRLKRLRPEIAAAVQQAKSRDVS